MPDYQVESFSIRSDQILNYYSLSRKTVEDRDHILEKKYNNKRGNRELI